MATVYANAGTTTFASAGWSDGSGFSTPDNDMVVSSGGQVIQTAVDYATVRIHSLIVQPQFTGTIGSPTAPLRFLCSDGTNAEKNSNNSEGFVRFYNGNGSISFHPGTAGIDNLAVRTGGVINHVNGLVTRLKHVTGSYNIASAASLTTADVYGGAFTDSFASSTTFTTWNMWGGNNKIRRAGTTLNIWGGFNEINATSGTITTINVYNGSVLLRGCPTITTLNHFGGTVDMSSLEVATSIGTYNSYANARRLYRYNNAVLLGVTTDNLFEGANPDGSQMAA